MAEDREDFFSEEEENQQVAEGEATGRFAKLIASGENKNRLAGMYKNWFLDYASYVILDRAVPQIEDGLKPVQRRILHTMKTMYDGRYSKVANIVGQVMKFHPHGDASIKDALVQMGQKNLLIDCQGNWGNTITGADAAAGRYIEARLSNFAVEVLFNSKITEWMNSYDGRDKEPVTLPAKFPLVLQQGSDGIAVGLNCKIMPHNFNELIDASVSYLRGEEFRLFPDFPLGGIMDVSKYNDGKRGGTLKVRARIIKRDKKTLEITELPYGKTSNALIKSIVAATEKNKIKIKKIDDESRQDTRIVITLHNDISPDKTIDALYAFTDCEVSIAPNTCVIMDNKPQFMTVTQVLKASTERTRNLLKKELEIRLKEAQEAWHYLSLEKIFFEEKIYRILEKDSKDWEAQLAAIHKALSAFSDRLQQPVTIEDVNRLVEKPVRKISKFDIKECEAKIAKTSKEIRGIKKDLGNITQFTIDFFLRLKEKYGAQFPRHTEISNIETIQAAKVVISNAKLYIDPKEGFIGTDQKKLGANAEFVCNCSDIDDIIVFLASGKYIVTKITEKSFVGKDIIHAGVFIKNNTRTIYNVIYRDGRGGNNYVKRFAVPAVTRDKEYDLTQGNPNSKVLWFSANPNGEAEVVRVRLREKPKLKKLIIDYDFASLAVKGRASRGNLLTKHAINKIQLKAHGASTIGDKPMWFDKDINRLNEEGHGVYLGKFRDGENILAVYNNGTYATTNIDVNNHYDGDLLLIEKMRPEKVFTAIYFDGAVKRFFIKRFKFEVNNNPLNNFISEGEGSYLVALSDKSDTTAVVQFTAPHAGVESTIIKSDEFIDEKSWRAKGKRISPYEIEKVTLIEPVILDDEDILEDEPDSIPDMPTGDFPDEGGNEPTLF